MTADVFPFVLDDGGRRAAGFTYPARDCVCRSIAIAARRPYAVVHAELKAAAQHEPQTRGRRHRSHPDHGIYVRAEWFKTYMRDIGAEWVPTMRVGQGCTVHLRPSELPSTGRLVVSVSRHMTAIVGGYLWDDHDPSRGGTRCVYGYWRFP